MVQDISQKYGIGKKGDSKATNASVLFPEIQKELEVCGADIAYYGCGRES